MARPASTGKYQLIDALNSEWAHLAVIEPAALQRWRGEHATFTGCTELGDVLTALSREPDPAMYALLAECLGGDELAGRVVLQAMLGKIVRMVARDPWSCSDDYVAAMWCRIKTYPLSSRPRRIAANLALDTLKTVTRDPVRSLLPIPALPAGALSDSPAPVATELESVTGKRLIAAAVELGLIDPGTEAVMHSVYVEGMSSGEAATHHHITAVNVRYRCSRAVRRLAQHAEALLDAA